MQCCCRLLTFDNLLNRNLNHSERLQWLSLPIDSPGHGLPPPPQLWVSGILPLAVGRGGVAWCRDDSLRLAFQGGLQGLRRMVEQADAWQESVFRLSSWLCLRMGFPCCPW